MDNLIIVLTIIAKVTKTITLFEMKTVLTYQLHLPLTTMEKPTPIRKEELIVANLLAITKCHAITPTYSPTTTPKDEFITTTGNLVKTQINRSVTTSINAHTTTPNVIRTNIIFVTLTNILK